MLTEFFHTGTYNRNRPFFTTVSPSMDILVSSTLERLLFELSGKDDAYIASLMDQLKQGGKYTVSEEISAKMDELFWAGCCDEAHTKAQIGKVWQEARYLMDTHTAVAHHVLEQYREQTGAKEQVVVVSTASPFKFCAAVLESLNEAGSGDGLAELAQLEKVTGIHAPAPLANLRGAKVRFSDSVEKEAMPDVVERFLA